MGLGLPDGGHLTHGYYVSLRPMLESLDANDCTFLDRQEEDDCILDLLPVIPLRHHTRH